MKGVGIETDELIGFIREVDEDQGIGIGRGTVRNAATKENITMRVAKHLVRASRVRPLVGVADTVEYIIAYEKLGPDI